MRNLRILMTGAGAPGAPGIIACYRKNFERDVTVIGVDSNNKVPTVNQLDEFMTIPKAGAEEFIPEMIKLCKRHKIDVIQPLVTKELEKFSSNIALFGDAGVSVCVAKPEILAIANDKGKLLDYLKNAQIQVPHFIKVSTVDAFENACRLLGYPQNPICFKPSQANGSRGFRIIDEKINRGTLLLQEKPNSVYISYAEAVLSLKAVDNMPELLVMEYLPGDEYSVDVLASEGELIYCLPRKRLKLTGGISTHCIVEKNEAVINYCIKIIKLLKLHGNVGIQVRTSQNGEIKILEINPRVQGSIVACAAAGVNLPYLGIKLALGERLPDVDIAWGTEMLRYWSEVYFDNQGHAFTF